MPFMESYFRTQQVYLVSLPGARADGMSAASNKEKEIIARYVAKYSLQRIRFMGLSLQVNYASALISF